MNLIQIVILALVQGAAELLPVSSSAHVIVVEKLMGLDPSAPDMTFFLVMLHTGTMFAAIAYFARSWQRLLSPHFFKLLVIATACTGVLGLGLKKVIEKILVHPVGTHVMIVNGVEIHATSGRSAEIEQLFGNLPLIAGALFCAGALILYASRFDRKSGAPTTPAAGAAPATPSAPAAGAAPAATAANGLTTRQSVLIGLVQGLCLPFRGFSRSGATISTGLIAGVERRLAEEFSFALAVVLTPVAIFMELHRLHKATGSYQPSTFSPGLIGMVFAFIAGLGALKWLSSWLEHGKWRYFGYYCLGAALVVAVMAGLGY